MTRDRRATDPPRRCFRRHEAAGVSTLGVLLLVATTVTVAAAPVFLLSLDQSGGDPIIAGVQSKISAGPGGWGDGDEVVEIHHRGGRVMEAEHVEVLLRIDGTRITVPGSLGSTDGSSFATAAQPWRHVLTIPAGADVEIEVVWQKLMTEQQVALDHLKAPGIHPGGGHDHAHDHDEDHEDEDGERVIICHIPPGDPDARRTITVAAAAVDAHLAHGDHLGPCEEEEGEG